MTTSAEQQTKDALVAAAPLVFLVGTQIWPDEAPQGIAVPYVVYERASTRPEYCLNNDLAAAQVLISITAWAKTRAQANAIALAVTNAMHVAGHVQNEESQASVFEPQADEYAAVQGFEVWEI